MITRGRILTLWFYNFFYSDLSIIVHIISIPIGQKNNDTPTLQTRPSQTKTPSDYQSSNKNDQTNFRQFPCFFLWFEKQPFPPLLNSYPATSTMPSHRIQIPYSAISPRNLVVSCSQQEQSLSVLCILCSSEFLVHSWCTTGDWSELKVRVECIGCFAGCSDCRGAVTVENEPSIVGTAGGSGWGRVGTV